MKTVYEKPNVHFELFAANQAIAGACDNGGYVVWDCMVGPSISVANKVLSDNSADGTFTCTENAGWYAGVNTATTPFTNVGAHTNNNKDFTWTQNSNNDGWTITNLESALTGLLVYCTGRNSTYDSETNYSHWTQNGSTITHKTGEGYSCQHVHVGAVYGALSDVATGSR